MTTLTIAALTLKETQRRRILWIGLLMGIGFLLLFGVGLHYIMLDMEQFMTDPEEYQIPLTFLTLAGLLVSNFLVIVLSVLISVASISSEIDNHTIDAIITKPIRRWEVALGKWLGYAIMILAGALLLPGGIMIIVFLRVDFALNNVAAGLGLFYLEGLVMMTVAIAGGTRLSTMANGALSFMLYGIAFIGSWVEQIGAMLKNEAAVNIGIISSLLSPTEVLWRKASSVMQPNLMNGVNFAGPFAIASQPNSTMILYAVIYTLFFLGLAMWSFSRRDL